MTPLRTYALALLDELNECATLADVDAVLEQIRGPGIEGFLGELRRRWVAERGGDV